MLITVFIAFALFAAMLLIVWTGYRNIEASRLGEPRVAAPAEAASTTVGHCLLCHAPLKRLVTSDEVVSELERKIDTELAVMGRSSLRQPPSELLTRIYHS